jgi:SAM-dependent methyltransferase
MTDFRRDLFRGTARYYDRFRVPYPRTLIDDLSERAVVSGSGTLLDIACGTGQLTFALHGRFARTWAVDQEPDMIEVVREKATDDITALVAPAEELDAPDGLFELIVAGNAFHRFRRAVAAANFFRWLRPGGCVALVWSDSPWTGDAPWQRVLRETMARWQPPGRVPASYEQDRADHPDSEILAAAGFELAGKREFRTDLSWTADSIAGFLLSTSVLSPAALGDRAALFEAELRHALLACRDEDRFPQRAGFACELFRRP